jgi:glycosyltransferase involved in cell wall biosynthesis
MSITLSVCIPTFNRVSTLKEALDSIIPQIEGRNDVEVFISDNASDDGTKAFVEQYQARFPVIRYSLKKENTGFDGNIVDCIKGAKGEYVSFFSDDDIALPETYQRILNEISRHQPLIIYINHYAFYDNDPHKKLGNLAPVEDRLFTDGKAFFLFAGLGFVSSLTIKTAYAKKYTDFVKHSRNCAHLDIASRIALLNTGKFVYMGTQSVAARRTTKILPDWFTSTGLNVGRFYHELELSGLLDGASVRKWTKKFILHLPRMILHKKCLGDYKHLAAQEGEILSLYKSYPLFVCIYPLLLIPRSILRPPYIFLRFLSLSIRRFHYERS